MHMGDLIRLVHDHPDAEIAGIFGPDRAKMQQAADKLSIPEDRIFTDLDACMWAARPDLAILCAATADHADFTDRLAGHNCHVLVEKPFAASLKDARRMIAAIQPTGKMLAINWPLAASVPFLQGSILFSQGCRLETAFREMVSRSCRNGDVMRRERIVFRPLFGVEAPRIR